ncbi:MAG: hydrogenase iron-sulfur subunit [Firmicutes bacterium]|jgi:coenzyme F420-reducing hydrogenase delta subunit|nr:hydrogenase iron-sulfur subunit [Bacillota bacterium]
MCTGRVDPSHITRAFSKGVDGVFIGGCRLNECNYITHGNHHALNMVLLYKKILEHIGLNPERLRIEFMSGSEGNVYVDAVNSFVEKIKELGPLGENEGLDQEVLNLKLKAIEDLNFYLRLVENERLRVHFDTKEGYEKFYASAELQRLFNELIADKLAISEIMLLLREKPFTTGEISQILGLTPSEISRHLNNTARQGLVRYEESRWRFALA